jgi:hypothetical protein
MILRSFSLVRSERKQSWAIWIAVLLPAIAALLATDARIAAWLQRQAGVLPERLAVGSANIQVPGDWLLTLCRKEAGGHLRYYGFLPEALFPRTGTPPEQRFYSFQPSESGGPSQITMIEVTNGAPIEGKPIAGAELLHDDFSNQDWHRVTLAGRPALRYVPRTADAKVVVYFPDLSVMIVFPDAFEPYASRLSISPRRASQ